MILNQNWNIQYSEIEFGPEIGKGAYGVVYKAVWKGVAVAGINSQRLDNSHFISKTDVV